MLTHQLQATLVAIWKIEISKATSGNENEEVGGFWRPFLWFKTEEIQYQGCSRWVAKFNYYALVYLCEFCEGFPILIDKVFPIFY